MKNSKWKDVPGYNGKYQAHPDGRIRRIQILKPLVDKGGYAMINLKSTRRLWHRVIAETFLGKPSIKMDVNHKDCNRLNNSLKNLEWVTRKQNMLHAKKMGRMDHVWEKTRIRMMGNKFRSKNFNLSKENLNGTNG